MTRLILSTALASATALILTACGGEDLAGPPQLRLGRDECVECGMLISEDRCSSAMLIQQGGRREHVMFDDIGCMLDWERRGGQDAAVIDRFVHDHASRAWTSAASASFLMADRERLPTPMGTGIVAFDSPSAAAHAQAQFGGDLLDYAALAAARRAQMEARFGKP